MVNKLIYIISLFIIPFIYIRGAYLHIELAQSIESDSWLIFACGREGSPDNTEIYRVRSDGSELQQLTDNNLNDTSPTWSPDGEWIVYVGERKQITFLWMDNDAEIYRVRPDGSELQQLTDNNLSDDSPTWSPDGEWIAYVVNKSGIYLMRANGNDKQALTPDQAADFPIWSPDGEWIAFISNRSSIYRVQPNGENLELVVSADSISEPTWSPDGEWIAFISGQSDLYRVQPNGENLQLLSSMQRVSQLTWSPDGKWIAFSASYKHTGSDLFKVRVDGGPVEQLTDMRGARLTLAWSPDGERIAFSSNHEDLADFFQIYLIKPDGSDMQLLIDMPCDAGSPAWLLRP